MSENNAHTLGFRREGEVSFHVVLLLNACRVLDHYLLLVTFKQLQAQLVCEFDEGDLVGGGSLEVTDGWICWVGVGRRHIVAESEASYHVSDNEVLISSLASFLISLQGILGVLRFNQIFPVVSKLRQISHRTLEFLTIII